MAARTDPRVPFAAAFSAGGLALLGHAAWTWPFVADDTLISLRYARRLIEGKGLTFTDGEWVEGYSNLLLVLLTAALGALGIDLITAARIVGIGGALLAVAAVAAHHRHHLPSALTAALLLGSSAGLGAWAVGGLEQPLLAGLLTGAWALLLDEHRDLRRDLAAGGLLALGVLTRPDTPLFVGVAAGWALWNGGGRSALAVTAPGVAAWLAQLGFRLAYYGDWVPNTAHAKLALTWHRVETGLVYVGEGAWPLAVLLGVALVGGIRAPRRVRALLGASVAVWTAYVVFIGGDIFPARRHLVVVLPALAMLGGHAMAGLSTAWGAAALALAGLHAGMAETFDRAYRQARLEQWEWACGRVATEVGRAFRDADPLLATNAAGCWPYFSDLDTLDMLGLNDAHIAKNPTPILGQKLIGHELGDGEYVLERRPDLVIFGTWEGAKQPGYFGEKQLARLPAFQREYRLVRLRGGGRSALFWIRVPSPRIGPQHGHDAIRLPPWLLAKQGPGVVGHVAAGQVTTRFAKGARSQVAIDVPAGTWRASIDGDGPARISLAGGEVVDGHTVRLDRPGKLTVRIIAHGGPLVLRGVTLTGALPDER